MSHRKEQLASMLLGALQELSSRGFSDPRMDGAMITFTEIDLSPDMRNASVRVSILPEKSQNKCIAALRHASRHIAHKIGDKLNLRVTPEFHFDLDLRAKRQKQVFEALGKAMSERPIDETNGGAEAKPEAKP
jgi:ribosome-binding factor A